MPQGDSWGPLTLDCYMIGGITRVKEEMEEKAIRTVSHEVYMDDTSWTAATIGVVISPVKIWAKLSGELMLQENPSKIKQDTDSDTNKRTNKDWMKKQGHKE